MELLLIVETTRNIGLVLKDVFTSHAAKVLTTSLKDTLSPFDSACIGVGLFLILPLSFAALRYSRKNK